MPPAILKPNPFWSLINVVYTVCSLISKSPFLKWANCKLRMLNETKQNRKQTQKLSLLKQKLYFAIQWMMWWSIQTRSTFKSWRNYRIMGISTWCSTSAQTWTGWISTTYTLMRQWVLQNKKEHYLWLERLALFYQDFFFYFYQQHRIIK